MSKYQLQILLKPNYNPHHPKGGWFKTGKYETKSQAEGWGRTAVNNGASDYKITEVEENEKI